MLIRANLLLLSFVYNAEVIYGLALISMKKEVFVRQEIINKWVRKEPRGNQYKNRGEENRLGDTVTTR